MVRAPAPGDHFDMDPPHWMRRDIGPNIWTVLEHRGMFALVAPIDRCCIPAQVTIASLERATDAGAIRPCSIVDFPCNQGQL